MLTHHLYLLQQVDSALSRAIGRRQHLDDGTPQRAQVEEASAYLAAVRQDMAGDHGRLKALELEVQSLQAKRTKIEREMYSGRVGNPKELSAMHEDLAALGRLQSAREEDVLQLMVRAEDFEAEAKAAEARLQAAEADLTRIVEAYQRDVEVVDREVADLTARRQALAAEVDEHILRRYERLREQKAGLAVVAVKGGVCQGCHVMVPQRLASRLERDPELLAACDGCGRLLVVLPADAPGGGA